MQPLKLRRRAHPRNPARRSSGPAGDRVKFDRPGWLEKTLFWLVNTKIYARGSCLRRLPDIASPQSWQEVALGAFAGEVPEFFASKVQHIEDMGNGNLRVWYCVERTTPDGKRECDTVATVIMPVAAIPDAVAKRQAVFGKTSSWACNGCQRNAALLLQ